MANTGGNGMRIIHRVELEDWSSRASRPWGPVMASGRQFNSVLSEAEDFPGMAAYDALYDLANLALQWLDDNPCPDKSVGRQFKAQMMAYRAVADTVRSTITDEDGDAMVAQLRHLRDVIDRHSEATGVAYSPTYRLPAKAGPDGASITPLRRRVPRQPAGWDGICHIEGEPADGGRECRVIDISMLGLGMSLNHPSPSRIVGRRISVDVPTIADSVSIRLEGMITNAGPTLEGFARVGIEFDEPSVSELGVTHDERTLSDHGGNG